jgi:hypothetical protein
MASSISSSEEIVHETSLHALPSGLRLTTADRPDMAQPVPERDIPEQPWRAMARIVMVLVILLTSLWEWRMRTLELVPGDLGADYDYWAELRRQINKRDVPIAIIGDSRILRSTIRSRPEIGSRVKSYDRRGERCAWYRFEPMMRTMPQEGGA